jgi:radical SAM-linked protein
MTNESPVKQRLQITFGKSGALKYTGNLDIAKTWERVLRRADLPILYTKGFNTRPRIQLASALPLGISSECEILDVSLRETIVLDGLIEKLLSVSPEGLQIYQIKEVPVNSPTLQTLVRSAEYRIHFEDEINRDRLQAAIDNLMAADSIMKTKQHKGKERASDLRPLIYSLKIDESGDLIAHIAVGDFGNVRPEDILSELGLQDEDCTVHRFRLHLVNENPTVMKH